uniref:Uncharacterized protein n=1 Tax=Branchiostoma floridae TaxID=7739 RepID=C3XRW2_BRAFL|eukprot:XP_002613421.1 hypothetical protein BRAFLDRAFT_93791 [Branchiostoma floridae]
MNKLQTTEHTAESIRKHFRRHLWNTRFLEKQRDSEQFLVLPAASSPWQQMKNHLWCGGLGTPLGQSYNGNGILLIHVEHGLVTIDTDTTLAEVHKLKEDHLRRPSLEFDHGHAHNGFQQAAPTDRGPHSTYCYRYQANNCSFATDHISASGTLHEIPRASPQDSSREVPTPDTALKPSPVLTASSYDPHRAPMPSPAQTASRVPPQPSPSGTAGTYHGSSTQATQRSSTCPASTVPKQVTPAATGSQSHQPSAPPLQQPSGAKHTARDLHDIIYASGQYNFRGFRIPLQTQLNIPAWRSSLEHYVDNDNNKTLMEINEGTCAQVSPSVWRTRYTTKDEENMLLYAAMFRAVIAEPTNETPYPAKSMHKHFLTFLKDIPLPEVQSRLRFLKWEQRNMPKFIEENKALALKGRKGLYIKKMENYKLAEKCNVLERFSRRNNFRLVGVPVSSGENCINVVSEILKNDFNLESATIERAHRDGKGFRDSDGSHDTCYKKTDDWRGLVLQQHRGLSGPVPSTATAASATDQPTSAGCRPKAGPAAKGSAWLHSPAGGGAWHGHGGTRGPPAAPVKLPAEQQRDLGGEITKQQQLQSKFYMPNGSVGLLVTVLEPAPHGEDWVVRVLDRWGTGLDR